MNITVAICTWNRATLLDKTLEEMHKLHIAPGVTWELLVVNNNCTDETDEVISRHAAQLPLRRLFEPTPGQTSARNCAIAAATGDLILWTDDDVLVDSGWIAAYCAAAARHEDAGFFGGRILPWFEGTPPGWLRDHWRAVAGAFAVRDLGDEPFHFTRQVVPYGANFAVRTEVQRRYPFDPELGLRPGSGLRGDETTLMRKMIADGLTGWWVPEAQVRHFLPKCRQTTRYLWEFARGYGEYLVASSGPVKGVHWFKKPPWLWRQMVQAGLRYYVRRPFVSPEVWMRDMMKYGEYCGQIRAYGKARRTIPTGTPNQ